jgi:cation transport ATPase
MNWGGVFALFGFPDDEDNSKDNKKIKEELEAYKETPYFKLGMFYKLIMNGQVFKKQILNFFSKADPSLDAEGIDEAGEFMMFTRAYFWIEGFKFKSKFWKEALKKYSNDEFLVAVKLSIHYFEGTEEYEKCAHLQKILVLIEKNILEEKESVPI